MDNVPSNRVYEHLHKALSPSSSTKLHKKSADNTPHEPINSNIDERIIGLSQMRVDFCNRLPANHPLKPPMIEPLNVVPADADLIDDYVGSEFSNLNESSSSHPSSTNQTSGTSVLENLLSHYSGELPGVELNLQKASEVASMEVALESPPSSNTKLTNGFNNMSKHLTPEHDVSELSVPEQLVPDQIESLFEQTVSEPDFMITSEAFDVEDEQLNSSSTVIVKSVSDQPSITNNQT
jgi:hypothetical protein